MADELETGGALSPGQQNVTTIQGQSITGSLQAPTSTGNIWFSFSINSGWFTLDVTFDGEPGKTSDAPIVMDITRKGNTKLAWLAT